MSICSIRYLLFLSLIGSAILPCGATKRVMTPDDLFRLRTVGEVVVSPDGKLVAYVVQRPSEQASRYGRQFLRGNDHADIWVVSATGGASQNITNGAADKSGFWMPRWSPDGERLAMVSTRGGDVRLWTWSKGSRKLQMISPRAVNPTLFGFSQPDSETFQWISDRELVFWVSHEGGRSRRMVVETNGVEAAERGWTKAWVGRETTASTLESGVKAVRNPSIQAALLLADVVKGSTRVVSTAIDYGEFSFATLRLAPGHRSVAFLRQIDIWRPRSDRPITENINPIYQIVVADLGPPFHTRVFDGVKQPLMGSLSWSPDGSRLASVGFDGNTPSIPKVFVCTIDESLCKAATRHALKFDLDGKSVVTTAPYLWSDEHDLLLSGELSADDAEDGTAPNAWWKTDEQGDLHPALSGLNPTQLLFNSNQGGFIGLIDGEVWRISKTGALVQRMTLRPEAPVNSITCPKSIGCRNARYLFLSGPPSHGDLFYVFDVISGRIWVSQKPSDEAKLVDFDFQDRTEVYIANTDTGTFLWVRGPAHEGFKEVLSVNEFLREIESGKLRKVTYHSLKGQQLVAWVVLPTGFQDGRRYPVVTWVYGGQTFGDNPPTHLTQINDPTFLNLQLLAARGYAVLLPTMPAKERGELADPYMDLANGVIPAIDQLVALGIADADRVAVMGHSSGGYCTYGLITQSNRFRAAVALAGESDLVSAYGTFGGSVRYQPFAQEEPFRMWNIESAGMLDPPWSDTERYLRNSPIFYASRVETPVLIIHDDLDAVPIQQAEEFFTALYRQSKRARFVRYWGEDHLLTSPANIRDMWQQIYAWLDTFVKERDRSGSG